MTTHAFGLCQRRALGLRVKDYGSHSSVGFTVNPEEQLPCWLLHEQVTVACLAANKTARIRFQGLQSEIRADPMGSVRVDDGAPVGTGGCCQLIRVQVVNPRW